MTQAIERIQVDGKVYRRSAWTGDSRGGFREIDRQPDPSALDWFWSWVPEDRFGTVSPAMPIDEIADP